MTHGATSGSSIRRTVTAFFDNRRDAEEAIERLIATGVSRDCVRLMPGNERDPSDGPDIPSGRGSIGGFWDALSEFFLPDEDRRTYAEGLRRGGYLVSVNATDAEYERVLDILDDEGAIDMDERADSWRDEGWSATTDDVLSGATAGLSPAETGTDTGMRDSGPDQMSSAPAVGTTPRMSSGDAGSRDEEAIPVAEEQPRIGKRDVSHGRMRVRSYVTETPVNEPVDLREEHAHGEKQPADRSLGDAGNAFQERTTGAEDGPDAVRSTEVEVNDERSRPTGRSGTTDRP